MKYTIIESSINKNALLKLNKVTLNVLSVLFVLTALSGVVTFAGPYVFPSSSWPYALRYGTISEHVAVNSKSHDCEWGKAPIGNKECHLEKVVDVTHVQGEVNPYVVVYWDTIAD
jgi:hypothetical protein